MLIELRGFSMIICILKYFFLNILFFLCFLLRMVNKMNKSWGGVGS